MLLWAAGQKRLLILLCLLLGCLLLAATYFIDLQQYLDIELLKSHQAKWLAWRSDHPLQFVAAFFLVYCFTTASAVPGTTVFFTLGAGMLFGWFWGVVLASFAAAIGSTLGFLLSRYIFKPWVVSRFSEHLTKINAGIEQDGARYLLTLRLLPVVPFFVINAVMAVTCIRTSTFYIFTQLGMLPGKMVYVNAGTQLDNITAVEDIFSFELFVSLCLLAGLPWLAKWILNRLNLSQKYE